MQVWADVVLVLVLLLNFMALSAGRLRSLIRAVTMQGVLLGVLLALNPGKWELTVLAMAAATVVLKGVVIPRMLFHAVREVVIHRETEPVFGLLPCMLLGAGGTGMALLFSRTLPVAHGNAGSLVLPAALSTVWAGFLILMTRREAIAQVVGYLILENGVFVFGLLIMEAIPFLIELGVLLDLFVAIFVMGIIIHKISREFSSVNTRMLSELKE